MTNQYNTVFYTRVTNNLARRIEEHKKGEGSKFTSRCEIKKLVYYEEFGRIKNTKNKSCLGTLLALTY